MYFAAETQSKHKNNRAGYEPAMRSKILYSGGPADRP